MAWFQKRTAEEDAAHEKASEEFWADWHKRYNPSAEEIELRQQEEQARQAQDAQRAFYESPAGYARMAYDRGDLVLELVIMTGYDLNAVCYEGWDLLTGSVVTHYAQQGWALCHYLFKRCDENRRVPDAV